MTSKKTNIEERKMINLQAIGINPTTYSPKEGIQFISKNKDHNFILIKFFGSSSCPPCKRVKSLLSESEGDFWNKFMCQKPLKKAIQFVLNNLESKSELYILCMNFIKTYSLEIFINLIEKNLILTLIYLDVSELFGYEQFKHYESSGIPMFTGSIIQNNKKGQTFNEILYQEVGYNGANHLEMFFEKVINLGVERFFHINLEEFLKNYNVYTNSHENNSEIE